MAKRSQYERLKAEAQAGARRNGGHTPVVEGFPADQLGDAYEGPRPTPRAKAGGAKPTAGAGQAQPYAVLVPAASLTPLRVEWLWPSRVPLSAVTLLDGDPGLGKSTLTIDLSARTSRGWAMPPEPGGVQVAEPADVVLLSAEDDPQRTIRPRLDAAGADVGACMSSRPSVPASPSASRSCRSTWT
jgi:hypothetical protein